jgi:subtilisin-like proprotein convertase family protein
LIINGIGMLKQILVSLYLSLALALVFMSSVTPANAAINSINGCQGADTVTFQSGDVSIPISPFGTPTITSTITVNTSGQFISDIDLKTFIAHNLSSDLDVTLTSPQGTRIVITSDNGGLVGGNFDGTEWDDSATPIALKTFTNNVLIPSAAPEQGFSAFQGENPNGTWTLTITDDEAGDGGMLKNWSLTLGTCSNKFGRSTPKVFKASAAPQAIPDNDPTGVSSVINVSGAAGGICGATVQTFISHNFIGDITLTLKAPGGLEIPLSKRAGRDTFSFNGTIWGSKNAPPVTDYVANYPPPTPAAFLAPARPFGALFASVPNGDWTLKVTDEEAGDTGSLDNWTIDVETCGVDSDQDGISDDYDNCPSDSQKITPGLCGCGISDADSNNNGILDCNANQEFKLLVIAAQTAFAKVKHPNTPQAKKKQKAKVKAASNAFAALKAFLAKPGVNVVGASGASIPNLHDSVQKTVKKALKSLSSKDLKKGKKAIKELLAKL